MGRASPAMAQIIPLSAPVRAMSSRPPDLASNTLANVNHPSTPADDRTTWASVDDSAGGLWYDSYARLALCIIDSDGLDDDGQ